MFKQGRQEQEKEIVYDNGEQMCCPYFKREMEKMENVKKALQEVYKSWRKYSQTLRELNVFILLKQD